jgi:GTP-binding protein YchF
MGFTCGIIGLPNVGKSTIFNALTSAKAAAANFPFCTIEPNTGAVPVPDPRLAKLASIEKSAKLIPAQVTFVDIAGLIRGASKGEGLGNQFLGHIRSVDAVAHVVRCFQDENVVHVEGSLGPVRDIETIETELLLSDLDCLQKNLYKLEKNVKSGDKTAKLLYELGKQLEQHVAKGSAARLFEMPADVAPEISRQLLAPLLTGKPMFFVANVAEADAARQPKIGGEHMMDRVLEYAEKQKSSVVVISGKVESEIAELAPEERSTYLQDLGLSSSGLDRMALAGYQLLNLITFFTAGPKETHAWTITQGSLAPQAAGKIHTDFERGFIRAEVVSYEDFIELGGEAGARDAGKLRTEGKEYLMRDGDVVHFRFNV